MWGQQLPERSSLSCSSLSRAAVCHKRSDCLWYPPPTVRCDARFTKIILLLTNSFITPQHFATKAWSLMVIGCCQLLATKLSQWPQSVSVTVYHGSPHLHYHRPSSVVAFCDCILVTKSLSNMLVILSHSLLRHCPLKKWKTVKQWHSEVSVGSLTEALLLLIERAIRR